MSVLYVGLKDAQWIFPLERFDLLHGTPAFIIEQMETRGDEWVSREMRKVKRFDEAFKIAVQNRGGVSGSG